MDEVSEVCGFRLVLLITQPLIAFLLQISALQGRQQDGDHVQHKLVRGMQGIG